MGGSESCVQDEREPFLVGSSGLFQALARRIDQTARAQRTTLITGPTGSGKDVIARTLHFRSSRRCAPFSAVHCGALPDGLVESELFGHQRGAFTGAQSQRAGLIRKASCGTIFLDEIDSLTLATQAKLLRFLDTGELRSVGADQSERSDAWILAATNQDLEARVRAGVFREDLYFRLTAIRLDVPALRDRSEDILPLARHFRVAVRGADATLADDACAALLRHDWRGNVRELKHRIEAAALLHDALRITADMLGLPDRRESCAVHTLRLPGADLEEHLWDLIDRDKLSFATAIAHCERVLIRAALRVEENSRTRAAGRLGIHVRTIYKKLNASGVPVRPCPVGHDLPERSSLAAVLGAE